MGRPGRRRPAAKRALAGGEDVGEHLGDRGAAVHLLPLLDQRGPDALLEATLLAESAGGVAHQDGGGPAGGGLQILDERIGCARDVGQGAVEELQVLLDVDHHAAVHRAAEVVGLQALAQVALVAGGDPLEQAGDLVDEQVGVGGHRLQARHSRLVALERLPDQLQNAVAPAGVPRSDTPGQIQAVEPGDA